MRIEKFVQDFANQFDETEMADTVFQELEEWSSLTAMSVIAFIKTEYGKSVTGKEIRSCGTIEDLFNLLLSK